MRQLARWAVAMLLVAGGGYALLALSEDDGPATAAGRQGGDAIYPERPNTGLVAVLPFVGSLTWECEEDEEASASPPGSTRRGPRST